MSRKARNKVANIAITVATLAGGLALTEHYAPVAPASATTASSGSNTSPASTSAAKSGTVAAVNKTVTSIDVPYQFGDVQVTVTRTNGKISAIDYGSSSATNGRQQAFPVLVQSAVQAQGSNFGNLSGATYTTNAFKQALNSAISKLG